MRKIVENVIEMMDDNQRLINEVHREDNEICQFDFSIGKLKSVFAEYESKALKKQEAEKIFVSHHGNPYVTAKVCMESVLNNTQIIIGIDDICYGVNRVIVKIVNEALKEHKVGSQILLKMDVAKEDISQMNVGKIVCLGNSNSYANLKKLQDIKVEYVPLGDIVLYYDSEEYEELVESIRKYAVQNFYEIEIFDETEELEDVVYMINNSLQRESAVLLSRDKEMQEFFRKKVGAKRICINESPFK